MGCFGSEKYKYWNSSDKNSVYSPAPQALTEEKAGLNFIWPLLLQYPENISQINNSYIMQCLKKSESDFDFGCCDSYPS